MKTMHVKKGLHKLKQMQDQKIQKDEKLVRLYFPTILQELNTFLALGIQSESVNFDSITGEEVSYDKFSIELTDKWHLFQATNLANLYVLNEHGEDALLDPNLQWWNSYETMPCMVEVMIPESFLIPSMSHLNFMDEHSINKKNVSWKDSLIKHGTVATIGHIPRDWIVSFTVMGDGKFLFDQFLNPNSPYMKDYEQWKSCGVKGKVQPRELLHKIQESPMIGTWYMEQMPELFILKEVQFTGETRQIALKIEEY